MQKTPDTLKLGLKGYYGLLTTGNRFFGSRVCWPGLCPLLSNILVLLSTAMFGEAAHESGEQEKQEDQSAENLELIGTPSILKDCLSCRSLIEENLERLDKRDQCGRMLEEQRKGLLTDNVV